jgi:hypothetical protein
MNALVLMHVVLVLVFVLVFVRVRGFVEPTGSLPP